MKKILLFVFLMSAVALNAQSNGELWNQGNEAYSMGQYQTALDNYLQIADGGYESYKLYYNIGNAYYKLDEIGKAILYYEKALKLDPSGADAQNNLQIARLHTLDKIDQVPEFVLATWTKGVRNLLSSNGWGYVSLALFAVVLVLLLMFKFAPTTGARKLSFVLACVVFLFSIFALLFSVSLKRNATSDDSAIVMVPVSNIKSAPNSTGNNLFILHEGSKVQILEQAGKWCRVEIADGRQGWMQMGDVEVI